MGDILCKIWRFLSDILTQVVDFVANALTTIGTAIVDVLSDLLQAAGSAIGDIFSANPVLWLAVGGVAAWWLFGGSGDEDKAAPTGKLSTRDQMGAARITAQGAING